MEEPAIKTALKTEEEEKLWSTHISGAIKSKSSNVEYCRQHGLSYQIFRHYKKKLGATRPYALGSKAFVKLKPSPSGIAIHKPKSHELPDPRWTAQLIRALMDARQ